MASTRRIAKMCSYRVTRAPSASSDRSCSYRAVTSATGRWHLDAMKATLRLSSGGLSFLVFIGRMIAFDVSRSLVAYTKMGSGFVWTT